MGLQTDIQTCITTSIQPDLQIAIRQVSGHSDGSPDIQASRLTSWQVYRRPDDLFMHIDRHPDEFPDGLADR